MEEGLSLDNILSEDQVNSLFSGEISENKDEPPKEEKKEENKETETEETKSEDIKTTETTPENLFGQSESVGSEESNKVNEDTSSNTGDTSQKNFYSSIANALVEDGILQNLNDEDLSKVESADDFANLISDYIREQLDDRQKRIDDALSVGVEPTEIQKYEGYIRFLNNISEEQVTDESDAGEDLRKRIIFQDCINKGFSKEKATKMVERSLKSGTDIEDAKDALAENKQFFNNEYNTLIERAREEQVEYQKNIQRKSEEFKKSLLEEEKAFGEVSLDKSTRRQVYEAVTKPVFTTPEGDHLTLIQKYEYEHSTDFLKNVGLLFVLTDGFKNIDKLVTDKVKKETKKSIRNLENTLSSSGNNFRGGNLSFANNSGDTDPESLFKGWKLSV